MSIKSILEKYISIGDYIYLDYSQDLSNLPSEEIHQLFYQAKDLEKIIEIEEYELLSVSDKRNEESWTYLLDVFFHAIIANTDGKVFDREGLKKDLEALFPNLLKITPDRLANRIKVGYKYVFRSSNINELNEDDFINSRKFTVRSIDMAGVMSEGGFLDLSDTLLKCKFFDKKGNLVSITDLKNDLMSRWDKTTNKQSQTP